MQFEQSPVYDEANKILHSTVSYLSDFSYSFELYKGKDYIVANTIHDIFISKDYLNNYTPVFICAVVFGIGTYDKYIVPDRRDLRAKLVMTPVQGSSTKVDTNRNKIVIEGKAVLKEMDSVSDKQPHQNYSTELGDKSGFITVHFQIINPLIEKMMNINAGGTGRVMTSPDYVKSFLLQYSKIIDNEVTYNVDGINLIEDGKNKEIIPNFIIPSNIKLIDVPGYVNAKISGVYPTGFGYFLEKKKWFVYPTYNTRLAEKSSSGFLTILRVPKQAIPEIKNSYRLQGSNLFILSNDALNIQEISDQQFLNKGNGGRWVDSKNMMEDFVTVDKAGNKIVDAAKNVVELVVSAATNQINNITGTGKITSNKFRELSKLSERNGSIATIGWDTSNTDLLYPGMPVKVIAWVNNHMKELYGSLIGAKEIITNMNEGLVTAPIFKRRAVLTLFLEKDSAGFKSVTDQ